MQAELNTKALSYGQVQQSLLNCLSLLFLLFLYSTNATAFTLSGTVYGDSSPLEGASVILFDDGMNQNASVTSDQSGAYQIDGLSAGNYSLQVVGPTDSVYGASPIDRLTLDSDKAHNVVLLSSGSTFKISGVVKDLVNSPIQNISVTLYQNVGGSWRVSNTSQTTDSNGAFEWNVSAGTYRIYANLHYSRVNLAGEPSSSARFIEDFSVTENTTQDIVFPFVRLSGRTLDADGNAVPNVGLATSLNWNDPLLSGKISRATYSITHQRTRTFSDSNGNYEMLLFTSEQCLAAGTKNSNEDCYYDVTAVPDSDSAFAQTIVNDLNVSTDLQHDIVMNPGHRLTGALLDAANTPISGATIQLQEHSNNQWITTGESLTTGSDGSYGWTVVSGNYRIITHAYYSQLSLAGEPYRFNRRTEDFQVSADLTKNVIAPFVTLSGTVRDDQNNPVANTGIETSLSWNGSAGTNGLASSYYDIDHNKNRTQTNSDGFYQMLLFPSSQCLTDTATSTPSQCYYDLTVVPPNESGLVQQIEEDLNVPSSMTHNITINAGFTLDGTIKDSAESPLNAMTVYLYKLVNNRWQATGEPQATGSDGHYQWSVDAGIYKVYATSSYYSSNLTGKPYRASRDTGGFEISGNTTQDVVFPFIMLSGKTLDSNGVGIPNVGLETQLSWSGERGAEGTSASNYYIQHLKNQTKSAADGTYSMLMFSSDLCASSEFTSTANCLYDITVVPTNTSGFSQVTVADVSVPFDMTQTYVLTYMDDRDPLILSGPYAKQITDTTAVIEWQTNEPTSGSVEIAGVTYESNATSTLHSVPVSGLQPSTNYTATVSSTDEAGNGPVTGSVDFTTENTPDVNPPLIIEGPAIHSITNNSFVVAWKTSEPSASYLVFGEGSTLNTVLENSVFTDTHTMQVTGLAADTLYSVQAWATDAAGNGPTKSHVVQATTLSDPDSTPPLIISGPVVTDITDTAATISWRTNEPAVSALSLNDGNQHRVINLEGYTTEHQVRVTDLTPSTTYEYTVSATDATGNGPTLSAPDEFTTLDQVDDKPPVFIGQLKIVGITHQSAVVKWRTDEPSDSVVYFGTDPNQLIAIATNTKILTNHVVHLTDLEKDTLYYVQASSTDAAGNQAFSAIGQFSTRKHPDTKNPKFVKSPRLEGLTDTTATISWETDEPTDALVLFGDSSQLKSQISVAKRSKKHTVTLTNLQAGREYGFTVKGTDESGNQCLADHSGRRPTLAFSTRNTNEIDIVTIEPGFTTDLDADTAAPVFTQVPAAVWADNSMAVISFATDEPVSSELIFNLQNDSNVRRVGEIALKRNSLITLTNLEASSTYSFTLRVRDVVGNLTTYNGSLNTASSPDTQAPTISLVSGSLATSNTVSISWYTDEITDGYVEVINNSGSSLQTVYSAEASDTHEVLVTTANDPSTLSYRITAIDNEGNNSTYNMQGVNNDGDGNDGDGNDGDGNDGDGNDGDDGGDNGGDGGNDGNDDDDTDSGTGQTSISAPEDIDMTATGVITRVDLGTATAQDAQGNLLRARANHSNYFKAGHHEVTWSATDSSGLTVTAVQNVYVHPQASLGINRSVRPGVSTKIPVTLNGEAARYPVKVYFEINGSAEHNREFTLDERHLDESELQNATDENTVGVVIIEEGTKGYIYLNVADESQQSSGTKSATFTMNQVSNAGFGRRETHRLTVRSRGVRTRLELSMMQADEETKWINPQQGNVTVTATVPDSRESDTFVFDWSESDFELTDTDNDATNNALVFDPSQLDQGLYRVRVSVYRENDENNISKATILLRVRDRDLVLSRFNDQDGDGIMDADEGDVDSDGDRIADYLDNQPIAHLLPGRESDQNAHFMETEPGLSLILGETAFASGNKSAEVSFFELQNNSDDEVLENDVVRPEEIEFSGSVFDFEAAGLENEGDSVRIILPLQEAIPADGTYYKFSAEAGWVEFVENANNQLASAAGDNGACPSVGDSAYQPGLTEGHWCVQLTIEDGGPNDADGEANGTVVDPGAIGSPAEEDESSSNSSDDDSTNGQSTSSQPSSNNADSGGSGGGGSLMFVHLFLLVLFGRAKVKKGK